MTQIIAVYVAYRERAISDSVRSASAWVDRFVFYSAPFPGNTLARDDTRERALAATALPAVWVDADPQSEVKARNHALSLARAEGGKDAWALVMDGDELLLGEWVEPHLTKLGEMMIAIRGGTLFAPVGLNIYSTQLLTPGSGPAVSEQTYGTAPIVSACGVQPRLFPLKGAKYRKSVGAPGLFIDGQIQAPPPVEGAVLVNMRLNQTYENWLGDFDWEYPQ